MADMRRFAQPFIEEFSARFEETTVVVTWQNTQAVAVDWIQAGHPLAVTHNHGVIEDPLVFASGRVLLAYQSADEQRRHAAKEDLGALGINSPRTTAEVLALLKKVPTTATPSARTSATAA